MASRRRSPLFTLGVAAGLLVAGAAAAWILLHAVPRAQATPAPPQPRALPSPPLALPYLPDADTIKDDPTVAPDPKESADHNVSLPSDI